MQNIRISSDAIIYWAKLIILLGPYVIYVNLNGLKINFVKEVFDDVRYKVCIVTSYVLTVPDENCERCIYFQSCELMFRGRIY